MSDKKKIVVELVSNGETPDNTIYYVAKNGIPLQGSATSSEVEATIYYRRQVALARGDKFTTTVLQSTEI